MTFLLFGSTIASAAASASIAATISAVAGFIDCPPSTQTAPRLSKSRRLPAPAQTATTPQTASSAIRIRSARSAVWTCMFLTSTSSITPTAVARSSARPGLVGVDVHLHRARPADDEQGVAELRAARPRARPGSTCSPFDEEGRAVAELGQLLVDRLERDRLEQRRGLGQLLAAHAGGDAANDLQEPGAPCVHDSRLLEDVELLRGGRQRDLARREHVGERVLDRGSAGRERLGPLGERAGDRQDRALLRIPHGRVAGVARPAQDPRERGRVDRPLYRSLPQRPGDELREDDAGVPARAHEDGAADVGAGIALERVDGRAHGQGHVRPRVPVRDRVDVEVVDARAARLERGERGAREG